MRRSEAATIFARLLSQRLGERITAPTTATFPDVPADAWYAGYVSYLTRYGVAVGYNKAFYSLDCDDGIEYSACLHEPTPQELLDRVDLFVRLWNALNSLPEIQGRRVDAHLILGKNIRQIAREEGVSKSAVRDSIHGGLESMKKYLRKNF